MTHIMLPSFLLRMFGIKAFSNSAFVENEVLQRLPKSIPIQFTAELDETGDPIIAISSPEFEGIVSEARTREEAIRNAHDAILTYFDVPRSLAKMVEYRIEEAPDQSLDLNDPISSARIDRFIRICCNA